MLVSLHEALRRRIHDPSDLRNDRGATLVVVIIVMMVLMVGAVLVGGLVVNTASSVVSSRSTAQSRAAADAGLAAAIAQASGAGADPCSAVPAGTAPNYTVAVACDSPGVGQVTYTVTGTASGASTTLSAVYELDGLTPPTAGGPGLFYTYSMGSRLNSYVFDSANSEMGIDDFVGSAGVYASLGKIACGTGSVFPGDIYTKTGDMQLDNGCVVEGNAYIGGTAVVNGGKIEGSLIAPKDVGHTIAGTVGKVGGSEGNVFVGGTVTLNAGTVYGSVRAAGTGNSTLGSGTIFGGFTYKGGYGTWGTPATTIVKGPITKNTALATVPLPEIPTWQDVDFTPVNATTPPQAWADEGYKLTTVTGTACNKWSGNSADVTSVASTLTSRMIFDIRACSGNFDTNAGGANKQVKINRDIAIIANRWYLSGTKFSSADGQPHTIYLITPDSKPAVAGPQCNSPASASEQLNDSMVDPKIAIYIYTPCKMKFNSGPATFRGQVYSGELEFGGGVKVAFAPRNIPGYDFGEDVDPWPGSGGAGTDSLGDLISQRDVP
ncbi:hypothetical protein [Microbacterium sp. Bi121]|uniref:hypothetical protein n=1 Tax=Microbacterium sp. Bi121 TaxID=2822348 RepID=UPI001D6AC2C6|nr:hypothetical protein [Microbacterium sp. Bi121]CAH0151479.1 hypothetical protein SRABI121_01267 [Microbacterium sp. Bi121]